MKSFTLFLMSGLMCLFASSSFAQEDPPAESPPTSQESAPQEPAKPVTEQLRDKASEISETLNKNPDVQKVSAGILQPIYDAAEYIGFPMFHWAAFMLMVAGVISFGGQLILGKFFLLMRGSLNLKEILGDLLGFLASAVGLILTTQASAENSSFTREPAMVVSAAAVGVVFGLLCYWWGQSQEFAALRGKRAASAPPPANRPRM
jgi:hypothetical protein